jgi:MoaA/NifB/PqqE/SkfB family radical SAM enzyme
MRDSSRPRTVQLHLTRLCNLRCLHCYSSSGPEASGSLSVPDVLSFIPDAAAEGYEAISLSGGEPLLYRGLDDLMDRCDDAGLRVSVVTNGLLVDRPPALAVLRRCRFVVVSIDGPAERHDRIRAQPGCLDRILARLKILGAEGIAFGISTTLTRDGLPDLEAVARIAFEAGASVLQINPVVTTGRAEMHLEPLDDEDIAWAFVEAARLQREFGDAIHIRLNIADSEARLPQSAELGGGADGALASIIDPLVVREDGTIVPLEYGFSDQFAVGRLHEGRFRDHAAAWKRDRLETFSAMVDRVNRASRDRDLPFFNWYTAMTTASFAEARPLPD